MRIRTPKELGALIRDRRRKLHLDQNSLAQKVGVSRQWIVEVEKGKPRAEIGLLLKTINELEIRLTAENDSSPGRTKDGNPSVDIDSIVSTARGKRK